ncbi:GNAT family N-acetyltransferase [Parendozoicomonas haliclonae]|uniref:N-acetyltransferase domain-containing protein n=2 Tax=Parendozoicomonas haliclonae TaxID=1960125 RepID=A0A1X7ADN2_9GAMM|nr:hypothetical protein EHSB41UT_00121 [Parendozoicomonas haliclonae]
MTATEARMAVALAQQEGWNPGLNDAEVFLAVNQEGMLCIHFDGQPIGFSSVMRYDSRYAFFGLYMVQEEFRKLGFGMAMTQKRLEMAGKRCIGLDGVTENVTIYSHIGFRSSYRNIRFCMPEAIVEQCLANSQLEQHSDITVIPLSSVSPHLLTAFDRFYFQACRSHFLKVWCYQEDVIALAAQYQGELAGYIVIRPCVIGSKIGPLFAQSRAIAESLLFTALALSNRPPFYLDIPEPNQNAINLANDNKMVIISEVMRMYRGTPPPINLAGVYGITSLEMG